MTATIRVHLNGLQQVKEHFNVLTPHNPREQKVHILAGFDLIFEDAEKARDFWLHFHGSFLPGFTINPNPQYKNVIEMFSLMKHPAAWTDHVSKVLIPKLGSKFANPEIQDLCKKYSQQSRFQAKL